MYVLMCVSVCACVWGGAATFVWCLFAHIYVCVCVCVPARVSVTAHVFVTVCPVLPHLSICDSVAIALK